MISFFRFVLLLCLLICPLLPAESSLENIAAVEHELDHPAESPIPFSNEVLAGKEEVSFTMQLLNMLTTLGMLLGVVLLVSWAIKRLMRNRMQQVNLTSDIKILEQRPLTHKTLLTLIEIRGQEMAIAESAQGVTLLHIFPSRENRENKEIV